MVMALKNQILTEIEELISDINKGYTNLELFYLKKKTEYRLSFRRPDNEPVISYILPINQYREIEKLIKVNGKN
jgi:hypothetical protein